jgi:hypothetical protein
MESIMTNKILAAALIAASATLATSAFAQGYNVTPVTSATESNHPLTRAEVRAQLVQIEKAGYQPYHGNDTNYPADVQAAEARINAQQATAQADTSGYGRGTQGTSEAGRPVSQ